MAESTESPTGDQLIAEKEQAEAESGGVDASRAERAANLFDLRRIIGGLFLIYGVILTVMGAGESQKNIDKAAGINVNLYTGLAMIVVAAFFLLWAFTRPLSKQLEEAEREKAAMEKRSGSGDGRFTSGGNGAGSGATSDDERVGARAAT
jgi:hypothetical protein